MEKSLFSIIIVNWNGCELLRNCLNSISKSNPDGNYEIIVVDNASNDNSVAMVKKDFPDVILIENLENLGFARATNIGIKASRGNIILLLNSDAELKTENTFEKVEHFFSKHSEVGILGTNLIFPDGVPQAPGGKFMSNWELFKQQILFLDSPLFHRVKNKLRASTDNQFYDIDYVSGACLFVRKKVIDEIGMLEESFFMYGEDMELCYRAQKNGWRRVILLQIEVIHLKSQSIKKNLEEIFAHGIKNNCYLIQKFHGKTHALLAHLIYAVGLLIRFFLAFVRKDNKPVSYLKLISKNFKLCFSY